MNIQYGILNESETVFLLCTRRDSWHEMLRHRKRESFTERRLMGHLSFWPTDCDTAQIQCKI